MTAPGPARPILAAAVAVFAACASLDAQAAPRQGIALPPGQAVEGVLRDTTPSYGQRGRFHLYHFEGIEGERYVLDLESPNFDAYLTVGDRAAGIFGPIVADDDGGDGLDARVLFTAPRTGTYLVLAQAIGPGDVGLYTIRLERLGRARPAVAMPLSPGSTTRGEISLDDPVLVQDGVERSFDLYSFQADAGARYVIALGSTDFDAYLEAGELDGTELDASWSDDDSGGGRDSRLVLVAPVSGTFGIRARALGAGTGAYVLRIDTLPDPGPVVPRTVAFGDVVHGDLSMDDPILEDGSFFDMYTLHGEAGDEAVLTLESDAFDAFLTFGHLTAGDNEILAADDDSGGNRNSRIVFRLPEDGEYHIRVESLRGGQTGPYRLAVEHTQR